MADELDKAQEYENNIRQFAVEANRLQPDKPYDENEEDQECEECGEIIPRARRKAVGSMLCVECKSYLSKFQRAYKVGEE